MEKSTAIEAVQKLSLKEGDVIVFKIKGQLNNDVLVDLCKIGDELRKGGITAPITILPDNITVDAVPSKNIVKRLKDTIKELNKAYEQS